MSTNVLSQYNSLVLVANAALGGGGEDKPSKPQRENLQDKYNDVTAGSHSVEDAVARINAMLRIGG